MKTSRWLWIASAVLLLGGRAVLASPSLNYLAAPVDITPAVTNAWVDVDVSPYVPAGATGVLVLWRHTGAGSGDYGIRMNGSTDAWETIIVARNGDQGYLMTGVDGNRILEIYTETTVVRTLLVGYTMEGVTFFTNRIDKSTTSTGAWVDLDVSPHTGADRAIGAIFTIVNTSPTRRSFALRKKGSTDDRFSIVQTDEAVLGLIGVDDLEVAQQKIQDASMDMYLVGYVTSGAVFFTNGVDKTAATIDTYLDVDITPDIGFDVANGAFVEISPTSFTFNFALRRNGAAEDFYSDMYHGFGAIGVDAAHRFEQKVENVEMRLHLVGYSLEQTDVRYFSATAKDNQVELEWLDPAACVQIHLRRDTLAVAGPASGSPVAGSPFDCATGGPKHLVLDPVSNGVTYHYGIFVEYPGPSTTPGRRLTARPFSTAGPVKYAYSTGATALAAPGLRFFVGGVSVYAVSNDSILHAFQGGDTPGSGLWPSGWNGFQMSQPAQARPPVLGFPVGASSNGVALLGSQNGSIYAVNADTGVLEWSRAIAAMVQAAPAGNFRAYSPTALDFVLVGTRDGGGPNAFVALDVHTGTPQWSFVNSAAQNGDGLGIGIISSGASVGYNSRRVHFASRALAGGSSNTIWCVDFAQNPPRLVWAGAIGDIDGAPVLHGHVVYVGTNAGEVYALDTVTGAVNWSRALGDGPVKGFVFPQFATSNVLVSTNQRLWSIADNGASSTVNSGWPVATIPSPSTPSFVPGTTKMLVGSTLGRVFQVDALAPAVIEVVILGDGTADVGPPTVDVVNSMFYVGTSQGIVYGVRFPLP
jgi:outer membrane protein assembly factor BamB